MNVTAAPLQRRYIYVSSDHPTAKFKEYGVNLQYNKAVEEPSWRGLITKKGKLMSFIEVIYFSLIVFHDLGATQL